MTVYQSSSQPWRQDEADACAAREILAAHVPDKATGRCVACLTHAPCWPANAAANRLVELGRPVLPPHEPKRRRRGWREWLGLARRAEQPAAPLLTDSWRVRLGLPTTERRPNWAAS